MKEFMEMMWVVTITEEDMLGPGLEQFYMSNLPYNTVSGHLSFAAFTL